MFLFAKLILGAVIICFTVIIHAFMCDIVLHFLDNHARNLQRDFRKHWQIISLIVSVFLIVSALMTDIWIWTFLFYYLEPDLFQTIEAALYFSSITFTTVGYGDVVLPMEWRVLSGTAAINGMLLFGWSSAFIFEIITKLYDRSRKNE
ncbi:MAG: ion channel [Pseudomonadota bacterium]